jgi:hypothetical protein
VLERTSRACASSAAGLTWIDVPTVSSAGRIAKVRESCSIGSVVHVNAVTQTPANRGIETWERGCQHATDNQAQCNVCDVIEDSTTVWKTGRISTQQSKPIR